MSTPFIALVGCGYWGKNLARNFHALGALHTLCDASAQTLASYGAEYSTVKKVGAYSDVLKDVAITAVAIAAPAAVHHRLAKEALLAGKDVYVEKPLCLDLNDAEELVKLANEFGRVLMVGHLLQYHPCVLALQGLVAKGDLGKLQYIISNRLNLGKIRKEENALWSFAPHDISVVLSLVNGQMPEQVICTGGEYLNQGVADATLTAMQFAGGVRAHVFVSWLNPFKEQKLTVVGSHGMAVFDDTKPWAEKLVVYRQYLTWSDGQVPTPNKAKGELVAIPESEPLRDECSHFIECCTERKRPRTDGSEGKRVLAVLQAAQRSLEGEGKPASPSAPVSTAGTKDYFVHPSACADAGAKIGKGTKIWHSAHISAKAVIGERCIFGQNTFVADDVVVGNNVKVQNNVAIYTGTVIEDDVFLGPSCVLTNVTNPRSQVNRHSLYEKTHIRRGATIGANATIVCGTTLGRYCFVAAGAVVTKDVPDYALMMGNPARQKGWMSRHGHLLTAGPDGIMVCPESGYRFRESEPGILRCIDLDEERPLPEGATQGTKTYDEFKHA